MQSCNYDDFDKTFGYGIPSDSEDKAHQWMDGGPTDDFVEDKTGNSKPLGKWVNNVLQK